MADPGFSLSTTANMHSNSNPSNNLILTSGNLVLTDGNSNTSTSRMDTNAAQHSLRKRSRQQNEEQTYMTATGSKVKDEAYDEATRVVGHAASPDDVVAIEEMLQQGYGEVGHVNCKLELLRSRLGPEAGRGLFVKQDCAINHGECITEYTGKHLKANKVDNCSLEEQLYIIGVDDVYINGHKDPVAGQGFGSFVNSAVAKAYPNVIRLVVYKGRIFFMCVVDKRYPLRDGFEIYFTAGAGWWSTYQEYTRR